MKKRTAVLVLAAVLSLSVVGCGNSAEPKQEESTEVEQEETKEADQDVTTQEFSNDDIVIKVEDTTQKYGLNELEYEDAEGTITPDVDVPIYCEDGYQIGHINAGSTIEITEHALNSAWYRFPNPITGTSYDYIFVGSMDTDLSKIYCESYAGTYASEEAESEVDSESEEYVDPYEDILSIVGEMVDTEKLYTQEEFEELFIQIIDKSDFITYNPDLGEDAERMQIPLNLQGGGVEYFFKTLFYHVYGAFGWCEEMGIDVVEVNGVELKVEVRFTYE